MASVFFGATFKFWPYSTNYTVKAGNAQGCSAESKCPGCWCFPRRSASAEGCPNLPSIETTRGLKWTFCSFPGSLLGVQTLDNWLQCKHVGTISKSKVLIINTFTHLRINTLRSQLGIKELFMHSYFYYVVNWGQTGWYCLCTLYNVERFPFSTQWRPLFLAPVRLSAHTLSISQQNKPPNRTNWIEALTGALLYGHSVLYIKLPVVYKQTPRGEICELCGH